MERSFTGTAEWQDVLKLYDFDKSILYCMLPKVTDRHVRPSVQSQMKVKLPAQVIAAVWQQLSVFWSQEVSITAL
jgi:hypothetical protein